MPIHASNSSISLPLWTALILLTSAYTLLGSFLAGFSVTWLSLSTAIAAALLITIVLSFPQFIMRRRIIQWLGANTSAFILLIVSAALVSVILLWLHIFIKIITIFAAGVLVKLELRHYQISIVQSFWLLFLTSFSGLSLGWIIHLSI